MLKLHNTQELFNEIILEQRKNMQANKLAWDEKENMGLYNDAKHNCKCPVGNAIKPELYSPAMEGLTVKHKFVSTVLKLHGYSNLQIKLLDQLQIIHDTIQPKFWENEWQKLADKFNLTKPN